MQCVGKFYAGKFKDKYKLIKNSNFGSEVCDAIIDSKQTMPWQYYSKLDIAAAFSEVIVFHLPWQVGA